jgi:uncharacterized membrane protein
MIRAELVTCQINFDVFFAFTNTIDFFCCFVLKKPFVMTSNNKVSYSFTDKVLEVVGVASSIAIIIFPMIYYADLPAEIPTHFNFKGEPDDWGSRASIWLLPVIAIVMYVVLSLLNYFLVLKQSINTSDKPNPETLQQVLSLMQVLKLSLNLSFLYIVFATIRVALGSAEGPGIWFLPVFVVLLTILPLFFVLKIAANSGSVKRK